MLPVFASIQCLKAFSTSFDMENLHQIDFRVSLPLAFSYPFARRNVTLFIAKNIIIVKVLSSKKIITTRCTQRQKSSSTS